MGLLAFFGGTIQLILLIAVPVIFIIIDFLVAKKKLIKYEKMRKLLAYFISFSAIMGIPGIIMLPVAPLIMMGFASDSGAQPAGVYGSILIIGYTLVTIVFYCIIRSIRIVISDIKNKRKIPNE
jgi:hypothetical protein